jgi:hypothetical protein
METKLPDGTVIQIDEVDIPLLERADWRLDRRTRTPRIASVSGFVRAGGQRYVSLARLIARVPSSRSIHYRNGDPLDLRRVNLSFRATPTALKRDKAYMRKVGVPSGPLSMPRNEDERSGQPVSRSSEEARPTVPTSSKNVCQPQNRVPRWAPGTRNR